MHSSVIDLRSDTVTQPTQAMREAMFSCKVGDDVNGEDPTLNELERVSAELLGKEKALFVPSGTFANQCAILTHTRSGNEVIVCEDAHIVQHEAGAAALLSRAQLRTLAPTNGRYLTCDDIGPRLRLAEDIHYPDTGLICLEQATAMGDVIPLETMQDVYEMAQSCSIPVHVDGARLFNAALALGIDAKELATCCDSVCFCMSKGLCAPVGSVLAGGAEFIDRARKYRKIMGGGMRQAGFLGAAGLVALREMRERLAEDHENAKLLGQLLAEIEGLEAVTEPQINILFVRVTKDGLDENAFVEKLAEKGVRTYPPEDGLLRFVTHQGIGEEDIRRAAEIIRDCLA